MLIIIILFKFNPKHSNNACVNAISIFTVFSKMLKSVSSCICAKVLHHIPTKMVCFLFLILCSENIVNPPAEPTMSQSSVHSCMPLQSWVGLCGLPLELHLMKLVRPGPVTMVKKTIELLSIHFMFHSLPLSPCKKHSRLSCSVCVQTVIARGIHVMCISFLLSKGKVLCVVFNYHSNTTGTLLSGEESEKCEFIMFNIRKCKSVYILSSTFF